MFLPSRRVSTKPSARSRASCCEIAGWRRLSSSSISETDFSSSLNRQRIKSRPSCAKAFRNPLATCALAISASMSRACRPSLIAYCGFIVTLKKLRVRISHLAGGHASAPARPLRRRDGIYADEHVHTVLGDDVRLGHHPRRLASHARPSREECRAERLPSSLRLLADHLVRLIRN